MHNWFSSIKPKRHSNSFVFNQSLLVVAFFFFFCCRQPIRGGDRERNMQRERERERSAVERERVRHINFLGLEISKEYIK